MKMKKILALALAALLLVVMSVAGTLAYLQATSKSVTNTFKPHDISIKLEESQLKEDGTLNKDVKVQSNTYQIIPGYTYGKDPTVTVDASVPVYVFVQYNNTDAMGVIMHDFLLDDEDSGWEMLEQNDVAGEVYWKLYTADELEATIPLLKDEQISFNSTWNTTSTGDGDITITFNAWAVQAMKNNTEAFEPEEAWDNRGATVTQQ